MKAIISQWVANISLQEVGKLQVDIRDFVLLST
jgi:hypothetical protein